MIAVDEYMAHANPQTGISSIVLDRLSFLLSSLKSNWNPFEKTEKRKRAANRNDFESSA